MGDNKKEVFEPGAARFGNFINYYNFNSVTKRIQAIPSDILSTMHLKSQPILCLDIGCNSGELTTALYSHLTSAKPPNCQSIFMLGIDLDNDLITRCKEANIYPDFIDYEQMNILDESSPKKLESYLQKYNRKTFDIVTCFSTTMWIHLNYGDSGLNEFLSIISRFTEYLLVEPQEWKCYKSAARRMKRLNRENFDISKLQIKDICNHLSNYLSSHCDMQFKTCFGETSWDRRAYLFQRNTI